MRKQPRTANSELPSKAPPLVPIIDSNAVFSLDTLRETLGLRRGTVPREIRQQRLRAAKRAGRIWILGAWVLAWIRDGEIKRKKQPVEPSANGHGGTNDTDYHDD